MWVKLDIDDIKLIIDTLHTSKKKSNEVKKILEVLDGSLGGKANREKDGFRKIAIDTYHDEGDLEIDSDAVVTLCQESDGAYVMSWKWVDGKLLRGEENVDNI